MINGINKRKTIVDLIKVESDIWNFWIHKVTPPAAPQPISCPNIFEKGGSVLDLLISLYKKIPCLNWHGI